MLRHSGDSTRAAAAFSEGLAKDLPGKAAAVAFSMACHQRSCQAAGGDALGHLAGFRRDVYRSASAAAWRTWKTALSRRCASGIAPRI